MIFALLVETWWIAAVVLRFFRGVLLWAAVACCLLWQDFAGLFGFASVAVLCHVGHRAACHLITDTARRSLHE